MEELPNEPNDEFDELDRGFDTEARKRRLPNFTSKSRLMTFQQSHESPKRPYRPPPLVVSPFKRPPLPSFLQIDIPLPPRTPPRRPRTPPPTPKPALPDPEIILEELLLFSTKTWSHDYQSPLCRAQTAVRHIARLVMEQDTHPVKVQRFGLQRHFPLSSSDPSLCTTDLTLVEAVAQLAAQTTVLSDANEPFATQMRFLMDGLAKLLAYAEVHAPPYTRPNDVALVVTVAWRHTGVVLLNDALEILHMCRKNRAFTMKVQLERAHKERWFVVEETDANIGKGKKRKYLWVSVAQVKDFVSPCKADAHYKRVLAGIWRSAFGTELLSSQVAARCGGSRTDDGAKVV